MEHVDEFCAPYASVLLDIDKAKLPSAATVNGWSSQQFVSALRHDQKNPAYNPCFRQLLHVGFKVAAKRATAIWTRSKSTKPVSSPRT